MIRTRGALHPDLAGIRARRKGETRHDRAVHRRGREVEPRLLRQRERHVPVDRLERGVRPGRERLRHRVDVPVDRLQREPPPRSTHLDRTVDGLEVELAVDVLDAHVSVDGGELGGHAGRDDDLVARDDLALLAGKAVVAAVVPAAVRSRQHGLEAPAFAVVLVRDLRLLEQLGRLLRRRGPGRERHDGRELGARRSDHVARDVLHVDRLAGRERAVEAVRPRDRRLLALADRDEHQEQPEREEDPDGKPVGALRRSVLDVVRFRKLDHGHHRGETRRRHRSYAIHLMRRQNEIAFRADAALARTKPFSSGSTAFSRSDWIVFASGDCLAAAASASTATRRTAGF